MRREIVKREIMGSGHRLCFSPPSTQFLPGPPVSRLQLAAEGGSVGEPSRGAGDKVRESC